MSEEQKGFWARLRGSKKSGCCGVKIEDEPEEGAEPEEAAQEEAATEDEAQAEAESKQPQAAPCCCGPKPTPRKDGGNCCG